MEVETEGLNPGQKCKQKAVRYKDIGHQEEIHPVECVPLLLVEGKDQWTLKVYQFSIENIL